MLSPLPVRPGQGDNHKRRLLLVKSSWEMDVAPRNEVGLGQGQVLFCGPLVLVAFLVLIGLAALRPSIRGLLWLHTVVLLVATRFRSPIGSPRI